MKRLLLAVLVLATSGASVADQAPPQQNLLFIFDASGSMWAQIEGTARITIAREVMTDLVEELPETSQVGLMAYGHRRKGDCDDIETLVPLGPLDAGAMIEHIEALNPKGKTPITAAVEQAVEQLRQIETSASIVLVSDGLESCGADPCDAVRSARQSGVDFQLHVVGFALGDADTEQLECMAEAGGGRFFTAADADELTQALETVSAPVEPRPETTDVVFEATDGEDGPVITRGLVWTLRRADSDEVVIENFDVASLTMAVEPGEYVAEVERSGDGATAEKAVTVEAGERQQFSLPIVVERPEATVSVPEAAAAGATIAVSWTGPDEHKDYIAVVEAGGGVRDHINYTYTREGSPLKLTMPPEAGDYEILYVQRQGREVLARQPIEVTAVEASVAASGSAAAGATIPVEWTGPDYDKDYIAVVEAGGGVRDHINYTYTREGSPLKLTMPPEAGDYEILYVQRQGREVLARQPIEVTAVEASVAAAGSAAAGATIPVEWSGPDYHRDYISVVEAGGGGRDHINYTYTREGSPLKLTMPPEAGNYEILYVQRQGREVLARQPIEVTAVEASIAAAGSAVAGATIPVEWNGPDYHRDYISVVEAGGGGRDHINYTYTREGSPLKLTMPPEAGNYEILYVQRQGRKVLARVPIKINTEEE